MPDRSARAGLHRKPLTAAVAVGGLLAGAALLTLGSEIPRGTTVVGFDVGGRSTAAAAVDLRRLLGPRGSAPVSVAIAGHRVPLDPGDAGLALDVDATAAASATRNPLLRLLSLMGKRTVAPVVRVDESRLEAVLAAKTPPLPGAMEPGGVRFDGLNPVAIYPHRGRAVEPTRAAGALRSGWLRHDPVVLPVSEVTPPTSRSEVDRAVGEIARPAVASPVTLQLGAGRVDIPPTAIAESLVLRADSRGKIIARFDTGRLEAALGRLTAGVVVPPRNAGFRIAGSAVQVVPSAPGRKVDLDALAEDLTAVVTQPAPRVVTARPGPLVEPELTTEKAAQLGIRQKISSFTTYYPCCPARNRNIQLVADEVDGAVVLPGQTFSLNDYTGPRGTAQGYIEAPAIVDGRLVNEVGGGISQFATTLFNAVFFSGLEDVYHKTHSYYISRYPAGREATVFYGQVDLKFRNDSPYGVLIDTSHTDTSITVAFWSTKRYDISSVSSARSNITHPTTQYLGDSPGCQETEGADGFDITVVRVFRQGGRVVRSQSYHTHYLPEPHFICAAPPG